MRRTLVQRGLTALLLAIALGMGGPGRAQDEEINSQTQGVIDDLRQNSAKRREFADTEADHARQWRELEANARKYAAASSDPKWKKSWLDDAAQYDKWAQEQEAAARQERATADAQDARAARLEAALKEKNKPQPTPTQPTVTASGPPPDQPSGGKSDKPAYRVEDVLGFWQTSDGPPVAIAILSTAGPGNKATPDLIARAKKHDWKGSFSAASSGPIVKLTFTPRAADMNPEIPEWARKAAEGKLVWRIELSPEGENYNLKLKGRWFSGEVHWDADSKDPASVEVEDEKDPYQFTLNLNIGISLDALELPSFALEVSSGQQYDAEVYQPDALTMGQEFAPRLTVPAEMAKKMPDSVTVTVKTAGGDSDTVELERRAGPGGGPVTYRPDKSVLIFDDCAAAGATRLHPRTLSWQWLVRKVTGDPSKSTSTLVHFFASDPGPCLQLDVKNGDAIEIRYNDMAIALPIYASWVQHGIARHKVMEARLRAALNAAASGSYGAASTGAAKKRLRMLDNYERIIGAEVLTDLHRYNVGDLYLGDNPSSPAIVLKTDPEFDQYADDVIRRGPHEQPDPSYFNPLMKAFLEGLSGKDLTPKSGAAADKIDWTSSWEESLVRKEISDTSDKIASNAVRSWVENFAFGGYDGLALGTGGGQLWLAASGTDHHGIRQSGWERLFAAVGFASNLVLTFSGGSEVEAAFAARSEAAALGEGLETEHTVLAQIGKDVQLAAKDATFAGLPETVTAAEREELMLKTVPDAQQAEQPVSCALREGNPAADTLAEVKAAIPGNLSDAEKAAERSRTMNYMRRHWGPNATVVGQWSDKPILPLQEGPTCQGGAANYIGYKAKGIVRSTAQARRKMLLIMHQQAQEWDMQIGGISFGRRARQGKRSFSDFNKIPGFRVGFDNLATRDYLRSMGGTVKELLPAQNARVKLRHIWSALQQNQYVKVIVDFTKNGAVGSLDEGLHAVVVEEVIGTVDSSGINIRAVRIYDSNIGRLIEVPAREFDQLLARDWQWGGILTLVSFKAAP